MIRDPGPGAIYRRARKSFPSPMLQNILNHLNVMQDSTELKIGIGQEVSTLENNINLFMWEMAQLNEQYVQEVPDLKAEYQTYLSDLKQKHEIAIENVKQKFFRNI